MAPALKTASFTPNLFSWIYPSIFLFTEVFIRNDNYDDNDAHDVVLMIIMIILVTMIPQVDDVNKR